VRWVLLCIVIALESLLTAVDLMKGEWWRAAWGAFLIILIILVGARRALRPRDARAHPRGPA
jgi:hypothetical protein